MIKRIWLYRTCCILSALLTGFYMKAVSAAPEPSWPNIIRVAFFAFVWGWAVTRMIREV